MGNMTIRKDFRTVKYVGEEPTRVRTEIGKEKVAVKKNDVLEIEVSIAESLKKSPYWEVAGFDGKWPDGKAAPAGAGAKTREEELNDMKAPEVKALAVTLGLEPESTKDKNIALILAEEKRRADMGPKAQREVELNAMEDEALRDMVLAKSADADLEDTDHDALVAMVLGQEFPEEGSQESK